MYINRKNVCRGDGRVYFQICLDQGESVDDLDIFCQFENGVRLKLYLVRDDMGDDDTRFGFYAPLLACAYRILVCKCDSLEERVLEHSVSPFALKWRSRLNYALHSDDCYALRGIERKRGAEYASVLLSSMDNVLDEKSLIIRANLIFVAQTAPKFSAAVRSHNGALLDIEVFLGEPSPISMGEGLPWAQWVADVRLNLPLSARDAILCFEDERSGCGGFLVLDDAFKKGESERFRAMVTSAYEDPRYNEWFSCHKPNHEELILQKSCVFSRAITFSIIVPLYKTPVKYFRAMMDSVLRQTYASFELVLVNASPDDRSLRDAIASYLGDERVKVVNLSGNTGIAGNTLAGIEASQGEFLAFLDHDDVLESHALFEYALAIENDPEIGLLYCDEDKLQEGVFVNPFFKPDFNLDLLRSWNYVCHFLAVRRDILLASDPINSSVDGAQDYDMVLKAVEKGAKIHHVDKILYHWRISEGSTAGDAEQKAYADSAGLLALEGHLSRLGIEAVARKTDHPGMYRVEYGVGNDHPMVSIIIPNKDHADLLDTCVQSLMEKTTYDNYEIIIVENNSTDERTFLYYENLQRQCDRVRVETWSGDFNFSAIVNYGVSLASGEYCLLLNNDTKVIEPRSLEIMLGTCMRDDVGAVGARLYFPDDTVQHAGVAIYGAGPVHVNRSLPKSNAGVFRSVLTTQDFSAVTGACLMTEKRLYLESGGLDEELAVAYSDIDYCLRLREEGYLVVYAADAELYHFESASRGDDTIDPVKKERFWAEAALFRRKWSEYYVKGDPYVNRNLNQASIHYALSAF